MDRRQRIGTNAVIRPSLVNAIASWHDFTSYSLETVERILAIVIAIAVAFTFSEGGCMIICDYV